MNPFDRAWSVVKAPLDLGSIRELSDSDYSSAMQERAAMLRSLLEAHEPLSGIPRHEQRNLATELSALDKRGPFSPRVDPFYRANHYDAEGNRFPMVARISGDGKAIVETYVGGSSPITEISGGRGLHIGDRIYSTDRPQMAGRLRIDGRSGHWGRIAEKIVAERMGLEESPFDTRLRALQVPHAYTEEELEDIEANYEQASDMMSDYSSGSDLDVLPKFQRKGIATAMRDFLSELNDNYLPHDMRVDLRPDPNQSIDAKHLWAANQNNPNYRDYLHMIEWRGLRERMEDEQ